MLAVDGFGQIFVVVLYMFEVTGGRLEQYSEQLVRVYKDITGPGKTRFQD